MSETQPEKTINLDEQRRLIDFVQKVGNIAEHSEEWELKHAANRLLHELEIRNYICENCVKERGFALISECGWYKGECDFCGNESTPITRLANFKAQKTEQSKYLVWSPTGTTLPKKIHNNHESALQECRRMAPLFPKQKFYPCRIEEGFGADVKLFKTEFKGE
jgi:transcription initiation factor IIE alpha subunit